MNLDILRSRAHQASMHNQMVMMRAAMCLEPAVAEVPEATR
jgi:hypothetical protein